MTAAKPPFACDALVHDPYGAHEMPIYQTSTFTFERTADAAELFTGARPGFVYTRIGNPTVAAWERRVAGLETRGTGIEAAALAFATGMGAITATILAAAQAGDHVVGMAPLYGGTSELFGGLLERFGIRATLVAPGDMAAMELAAQQPRTRVVYVETPGNPTMDIVDIRRSAEIAHAVGARLFVDNTFATPILQQPLALGADVVLHSATKYLGGHGTVVSGVVVAKDLEFLAGPVSEMRKLLGASAAPFDAWLLLQGVKTLELRLERMTRTAEGLARMLVAHEMVAWVRWPGLESDPGHDIAKRQMKDFGAMIAFGIRGGLEAGAAFMDALTVAKRAVSLGCTDTLIEHPASMTHSHMTEDAREQAGVGDDLIRVSVGLEDAEEIESDVATALAAAARAVPALAV
jgi:methionine-gamma-lyase